MSSKKPINGETYAVQRKVNHSYFKALNLALESIENGSEKNFLKAMARLDKILEKIRKEKIMLDMQTLPADKNAIIKPERNIK